MKNKKQTEPSRYEKIRHRRGRFLDFLAFLLALASMVLGIIFLMDTAFADTLTIKVLFAICCILPILALPLNLFLKNHYVKKLNNMNVEEMQNFIVQHREFAEQISEEKLSYIRKWRILTSCYGITLAIFGFGIAFLAGGFCNDAFCVIFCFLSAFFFMCGLSRIRFSVPEELFTEDKTYISEKDYPELYALARKAADELGCKGNIYITLLTDFNAGIGKIGETYSIQLGTVLLNVLSREELYSVLLHEFAHIVTADPRIEKEHLYQAWSENGGNHMSLSNLIDLFFSYPALVYGFNAFLYQYACSVLVETSADQKMAMHSSHKHAASALLKLKYYELFSWEEGTRDTEPACKSETPSKTLIETEMREFQKMLPERIGFWNQLIDGEILSRSASHPTLKMRLEILGVTDYQICESEDSVSYVADCQKALHHIDQLIYEGNLENYEEHRKKFYLEPLELVTKWETAGKPVIAEEYADVDQALRTLGRATEANTLCEQAIQELEGAASCYAHYMKGCYLLHSFDDSGIPYIYHAIENNNNYVDEGLDIIGEYCCLTGRQDDLESYRQKAVELTQKQVDFYNEIAYLRKTDTLSSENLPGNMLEEILEYIKTIDKEQINKIYLVRKSISEELFASAFVIRFEQTATTEIQDRILHKIFSYLDTCSDWQFTLFTYDEVKDIKFEAIPNSCVFTK